MKKATKEDVTIGSCWVYVDRRGADTLPSWDNMTGSVYLVEDLEPVNHTSIITSRNYKHGSRSSRHREYLEEFLSIHLPRPPTDKLKLMRLYSVLSRIKGTEGISNLEVYSILEEEEI